MDKNRPKVFCLMGPTASGKTALACALSERFPMEIISVDSAMVYRGMDIGTAKPSVEEQACYPHHLINIRNPNESFSVAEFCSLTRDLCHKIIAQGKVPLLVGGTMMYFHALEQGLSTLPPKDEAFREALLQAAESRGWPAIHQGLLDVDPTAAHKINRQDSQRIMRALEVYHLTGRPLSVIIQDDKDKNKLPFDCIDLILFPQDRANLHAAIAGRFQMMLKQGLVEETQRLITDWSLTESSPAMRMVGYRQAYAYLLSPTSLADLYERGIAATRQLAKRQMTWLRQWPLQSRYAYDVETNLIDSISGFIEAQLQHNTRTR